MEVLLYKELGLVVVRPLYDAAPNEPFQRSFHQYGVLKDHTIGSQAFVLMKGKVAFF